MNDRFGRHSDKARCANALVDSAVEEVAPICFLGDPTGRILTCTLSLKLLGAMTKRFDGQICAMLLLDNSWAARPLHSGLRALLATPAPTATSNSTNSTGSVSLTEIVEYNVSKII